MVPLKRLWSKWLTGRMLGGCFVTSLRTSGLCLDCIIWRSLLPRSVSIEPFSPYLHLPEWVIMAKLNELLHLKFLLLLQAPAPTNEVPHPPPTLVWTIPPPPPIQTTSDWV
ncbi:hypothetical protein Lalb_Chr06g0171721 [Lupinus albus]|uniref:Uncharacterized protein n=1 Tax=Lupinus albus TaxID=3870 RepID=A0A6A4QE48_LUPAL|nr:hypothetical protein Lalb_Chr06g0171721 [Lupinus albus]